MYISPPFTVPCGERLRLGILGDIEPNVSTCRFACILGVLGPLLGSDVGFEDGIKYGFILGLLLRSEVGFKDGIGDGTVLGLLLGSEYEIKDGFISKMDLFLDFCLDLGFDWKMGSEMEFYLD